MQASHHTYHFNSLGQSAFYHQWIPCQPKFVQLSFYSQLCMEKDFTYRTGPLRNRFLHISGGSFIHHAQHPKYFASPATYSYLGYYIYSSASMGTTRSFTNNPETGVNGSLWTLTLEGAYILLPLLSSGPVPEKNYSLCSFAYWSWLVSGFVTCWLISPYPFYFALFFLLA
jgi:hypothetical protein